MAPPDEHKPAAAGIPAEPDPGLVVVDRVNAWRRRLALQSVLRRVALVLAGGALFPLLVVVADHARPTGLPRPWLHTVAVVWAGSLLLSTLLAAAYAAARRWNRLFAARLFENCGGIRHNAIINALTLRGDRAHAYASAAAARQAAIELHNHAPRRPPLAQAWLAPALTALVVLFAWIVYALVSPKAVGTSLSRFLGGHLAAPTATRLELLHPDPTEIVHLGDALRLEVAVSGRAVETVTLDILAAPDPAGRPIATHSLRRVAGGPAERWSVILAPNEVVADLHYACRAGDASIEGTIPVHPQPVVESLEISLEPPAYTGWAAGTTTHADLDVLAGTRATLRARANVELRDPFFVLAAERETHTRMTIEPDDDQRFNVSLLLLTTGDYRLEFTDRWGYPARETPVHRLVTRSDSPPTVEIVDPPKPASLDEEIDISRQRILVALATDDVRVAGLILVRDDRGLETRVSVARRESDDRRQARAQFETDRLGLRPGQRVRVWFEASDNRVLPDGRPAPQTTSSRVLSLFRPVPPSTPAPEEVPRDTQAPDQPEPSRPDQHSQDSPAEQSNPPPATPPEPTPGDQATGEQPDPATTPGAGADSRSHPPEPDGANQPNGDFARELDRFLREHGETARDVARRISDGPSPENANPSGRTTRTQDTNGPGAGTTARSHGDTKADGGASSSQSGARAARDGDRKSDPATDAAGRQRSGDLDQPGAARTEQSKSTGAPGQCSSATAKDGDEKRAKSPANSSGDSNAAGASQASRHQSTAGAPDGDNPEPGSNAGASPGDGQTGPTHAAEPGHDANRAPENPPPGADAPSAGTGRLETVGRSETLHLLDLLRRGQQIDEQLLVSLGVPVPEAAASIKALERVYGAARVTGVLEALDRFHVDILPGDPDVKAGLRLSDAADTRVDSARTLPDKLGRIAAPPEQRVPARLRGLLDAYYRSIARHRESSQP